jgi:hypothetical protein
MDALLHLQWMAKRVSEKINLLAEHSAVQGLLR